MKILWLGAGASMSAGYPATVSLLKDLHSMVQEGVDVATKDAWQSFCEFRDSQSGSVHTILHSPNPEVVLTFPDLLAAALSADDEDIEADTSEMITKAGAGDVTMEEVKAAAARFEARYTAAERKALLDGRSARRNFIHVLNTYFIVRHHRDGELGNVKSRDSLRRELEWVQEGDTIITTNWDTTVERTLLEQGRWTPADGYGFPIELIEGLSADNLGKHVPLPDWVPRTSGVRVLKLHGSFGWLLPALYGPSVDQADVYLDYSHFLSALPFVRGAEMATAYDVHTPRFYDPSAAPVYIVPSYLKQLAGTSMQRIWYEALAALMTANEIRIVGASLPFADVAVRVLLNPLRFRVAEGAVKVAVHNPEKKTHITWKNFLGSGITTLPLKTGE